jgi:5-methylcytosine-specific restriction endonuclease McrA
MTARSGRSGNWRFEQNRPKVLAASRVCGICGHDGSMTVDHIIPARLWPRGLDGKPQPGLHELPNLQPAHGTMGSGRDRLHNPCPYCGRLCNQSKNVKGPPPRPQSRRWFG